jgi:hypothetical protein
MASGGGGCGTSGERSKPAERVTLIVNGLGVEIFRMTDSCEATRRSFTLFKRALSGDGTQDLELCDLPRCAPLFFTLSVFFLAIVSKQEDMLRKVVTAFEAAGLKIDDDDELVAFVDGEQLELNHNMY